MSLTARVSAGCAWRLAALACVLGFLGGAVGGSQARAEPQPAPACPRQQLSSAYRDRVLGALSARVDVWGNRLLASPGGPTFAGALGHLRPLLLARGPGGKPLTDSGVYYVPFAQPDGPRGAGSVALHVADGGQIVSEHVGGRSLTISVGATGRERYGSCLVRLSPAALAGGLPILETRYRDAGGARYRQESFATGIAGTRSLVSFVRVTIDTRRAARGAVLRLSPSGSGLRRVGDRLARHGDTWLVWGQGGRFDGASVSFGVAHGLVRTVYLAWLVTPSPSTLTTVGADAYTAARESLVAYWQRRLAEGMTISVPEARVENARRALLVQELELTWRYSIGNPYEEFSFPESVDVASVLGEQGFPDVARAILRTSSSRKPNLYPNWQDGERLLATAEYYRLFADRSYVNAATPVLRRYVAALGRQIGAGHGGLLGPERYSSDIADVVYGVHSQTVVWAGLRAMADVWRQNGQPALATTCVRLAARLGRGLRQAVSRSEQRLPDGSLFVPAALLDDERPYGTLTEDRLGSYWNLVLPYALASGFFTPGGPEAKAVLRYLLLHGSRLLGLVRAGGYALYGNEPPPPVSGTDEVYGINVARFLADNDQADQLVLSLYGDIAAGMTAGTFVSGEAAGVAPIAGDSFRAMYLPPNSAANAAFLETLRLMLVHETAGADGRPRGLQLAYATPRSWLRPGKRIAVTGAPTSFGPVSYAIDAGDSSVHVSVDVPGRAVPETITLRLRLPRGERIRDATLAGHRFRRFDRVTGKIDLSGRRGSVDLVVRLSHAGSRS